MGSTGHNRPTNAQLIFLNTIYSLWEKSGWYPSQREVGRTLHMNSSATSVGYVKTLEKLGLVEWHKTSGIKLTDEGLMEVCRWREVKNDPAYFLDIDGFLIKGMEDELELRAKSLFDRYHINQSSIHLAKLKSAKVCIRRVDLG